MTTGIAQLRHQFETDRNAEHISSLASDVIIGKDILELLSTAMYVNPLAIVREYIQNAADAIDDAYSVKLFSGPQEGRIEINIAVSARSIRIRDNGIGIPSKEFERRLTSFGASKKRGTMARGFRGVGRLAGLAYCQALVFRSRCAGNPIVTEMRWDCRSLKDILLDSNFRGGLSELVRQIVSVSHPNATEFPDRFFEVELEKVIRIKNDLLLNSDEVGKYLSQIAPAPFSSDFTFAEEIEDFLSNRLPQRNFLIYLNDSKQPIYRPFKNEISVTEERKEQFNAVDLIQAKGMEGDVCAIGWILHHDYSGAIHGQPEVKGLRARVGDMQVGEYNLFEEVFPETRFNSWSVGELHILDRRIIPNGRRDHFVQNAHFTNLLNQLLPIGRDIARRCRKSSMVRNRIKSFAFEEQKAKQQLSILEQGAISRNLTRHINRELGTSFDIMEKLVDSGLLAENLREELNKRFTELRREYYSAEKIGKPAILLERLPPKKKTVYREVIDLIYECSANKVAAKALVDRILARISIG